MFGRHLWAALSRDGSPEPTRAGGAWRPGRTARCPEPGGRRRGRHSVDAASLPRSGRPGQASTGTGPRRPEAPRPSRRRPDPPCSYLWEAARDAQREFPSIIVNSDAADGSTHRSSHLWSEPRLFITVTIKRDQLTKNTWIHLLRAKKNKMCPNIHIHWKSSWIYSYLSNLFILFSSFIKLKILSLPFCQQARSARRNSNVQKVRLLRNLRPLPQWDALTVNALTPSSRLAGAVLEPVRSWTRNSVQSLYFSLMAANKEKHRAEDWETRQRSKCGRWARCCVVASQ